MPLEKATVGDVEVSVEVEYPVYYVFRHLDKEEEPFMFLVIQDGDEGEGFSAGVALFLRKNFKIQRMTKSEAETYAIIGVAPMYSRTEFNKWVEDLNREVRESIKKWGMDKDKKVRCGDYVYDLSSGWDEYAKPW